MEACQWRGRKGRRTAGNDVFGVIVGGVLDLQNGGDESVEEDGRDGNDSPAKREDEANEDLNEGTDGKEGADFEGVLENRLSLWSVFKL